jgi:hypothetical protein
VFEAVEVVLAEVVVEGEGMVNWLCGLEVD